MKDSFLSIARPSEGLFKDKGSKFLGFAFPVSNEGEIQLHLAELQVRHGDAKHHCYAWRMGQEGNDWRTNDAGEPRYSAGFPILNEMKRRNLSNLLVVVVRYFGGTKLGIPGLIEAYGSAASDTLSHAETIQVVVTRTLQIRFPYQATAAVNRTMQQFHLRQTESSYGADCCLSLEVRLRDLETVQRIFSEMGIFTVN